MDDDRIRLAVARLRLEKARASAIARERQQQAKLAAANRGHYPKPTYTFNRETGRFMEKLPRQSHPTQLEINHHLYTWPNLAGEFSGPALRRAGEVWREAKDYYGADVEDARKLARNRAFVDGRFMSWPEFAEYQAGRGRSKYQAEVDWIGMGLRAPQTRPARPPAFEVGDLERLAAVSTGLIGGRRPRPDRPAKNAFRGDFTADFGYTARPGRAEAAPGSVADLSATSPEGFVLRSQGLQELPPPVRIARQPRPISRSPFASFQVGSVEHLPEEVAETKFSAPGTPSRSGIATPAFEMTAVSSPFFSQSASPRAAAAAPLPKLKVVNAEVDAGIRDALSAVRIASMTGQWRKSGGVKAPWRSLVATKSSKMDYSADTIAQEDDNLLSQVYFGGWKPRRSPSGEERLEDFFAGRQQGGKLRLEPLASRPAPYYFLTFVQAFWAWYAHLYALLPPSSKLRSFEDPNRRIPFPPGSNKERLPESVVESQRGRNRNFDVFTPQFWDYNGGAETEQAYIARLEEMAAREAEEYFASVARSRQ